MKVSVLKRIAAIESQLAKEDDPPSLIMIHYNEAANGWVITETKKEGTSFSQKVLRYKKLREYCFRAECRKSRVILQTFGCNDPDYYESLFSFDVWELQKDLKPTDRGSFFIESIKENKFSRLPSAEVTITAVVKEGAGER